MDAQSYGTFECSSFEGFICYAGNRRLRIYHFAIRFYALPSKATELLFRSEQFFLQRYTTRSIYHLWITNLVALILTNHQHLDEQT